jgi:MarR family transcriptional regulator, organic hydroperoxide resistance regulator
MALGGRAVPHSTARNRAVDRPPFDAGALVLPDVLQFMQLLWALDHHLQRTSKRMLRGLGVTEPQRLALRLIGEFPRISPGELAMLMHVHPSTLTGILARLLDRELIVRDTHADDARRSVLRLSRRGERLGTVRAGTVENAVETGLRRMSRADLRCVARVLGQLTRALASMDGSPDAGAERRKARTRAA